MKTNIIANITNMKSYLKYLCAVLLVIGTSAHAWGQIIIQEQTEIRSDAFTSYLPYTVTKGGVTITTGSSSGDAYTGGTGKNRYIKIARNKSVTFTAPSGGNIIYMHFSPCSDQGGMNKAISCTAGTWSTASSSWSGEANSFTMTAPDISGGEIAWNSITVTVKYPAAYYDKVTISPTSVSKTASIDEVVSQDFTMDGLAYADGNFDYNVMGMHANTTVDDNYPDDVTIGDHAMFSLDSYDDTNASVSAYGDAIGTYTGYFRIDASKGSQNSGTFSKLDIFVPFTLTVNAECTANPTVTAGSNSAVKSTTATVSCAGGITSLGSVGCTISSYGFVVGTSANPSIGGSGVSKQQVGTSYTVTGTSFSKGLTGLTPNTTYYVRPYATNGHGTAYGTQTSFTTLQRYTIQYNNNTGEGSISNEYKDHDATVSLNAGTNFSKTGHTLSRWDTNSGGGGTSYALSGSYSANADVTLYAIWTANPYTITLNNQSATSAGSTSIAVTYNASTNLTGTPAITLPTKTGYDFGGYYTGIGGAGDQLIDEDGDVVASVTGFTDASKNWIYANDVTLYALWTAKTISLTLDKNGGDADGSASVKYDATALESGTTHATRSEWNLVGYYAEVGTTTKVLESSGAFAASNVTGYITDGKWSRTTDPTTLYAKWSKTTYTVTFNMHDHGSEDDQVVESGSTAAQPADPVVDGWRFLGWFADNGAGSMSGTEFNFSTAITANTTVHAKWEKITYSTAYKAWCEPDIAITGDIHLTTTKDVYVYATSGAGNLIRIQSNDLAGVNKIALKYLDADNGDAEVAKGDSPFRFCNDGSVNYNVADGSEINVSASNTCDLTYSIKYTPTAYNVTHHYKLQFTLKHNSNVLKTVTHDIYGRSLPEEFVIAVKKDGNWYALPNTLASTQGAQNAIVPIRISVNDLGDPTAATYAPGTTIYKGTGRNAATSNINGIRFTKDGTQWLQTSSSGSVFKMWLSTTNSDDDQVWHLKSTNFHAYTLAMDPSHSPTKKMGTYDGLTMGYHSSPTSSDIYLLPVTNKLVDNPAIVTEWGQKSVILDVDAQGMAGAQARLGNGEPETATLFSRTRTSIKSADSKYNYTVGFSTTDFSAHKGELLYVDWLDGESAVVSTSAVEIPWIIAENSVMGEIDNVQSHWKDWEVHVLPGVKLEADGSSFTSSTAKIKTLEVYPGATIKVTSGTLNVTDLVLRYGWTRASGKNYDVARLYIQAPVPAEDIDGANLTTTRAYADWYIDFDQYYPVAVPWDVTVANITYKNSNTTATISGTSGTLRLRYYDGASRAENGQTGVGAGANWKAYGAAGADPAPVKMVPSMGYAMTAKRPTGKAFSIVRMPLTIPSSSWTALGEQGEVSGTHKNQITVYAYGVSDASKPWYTVGWNFIANPYMATYNGNGSDDGITGKLKIQGGGSVKYATIPNLEFTNYDQLPVASADLKPGSPFFVQVATGGTLEFSNSKIVDPTPAPAPTRYTTVDETIPEQEAYIRLSNGAGSDLMGLIIGEDYTEAYELNADLAKVLGDAGYVKTYMRYGDMDMAYVAINAMLAQQWIPVTAIFPTAGTYTYSLTSLSEVEHLEGVYLIDYTNNQITNLINEDYVFTATAGTISDRFAINAKVGERQTPTDVDIVDVDKDSDKPVKFLFHDKVYILFNGVIYDATGKRVKEINK